MKITLTRGHGKNGQFEVLAVERASSPNPYTAVLMCSLELTGAKHSGRGVFCSDHSVIFEFGKLKKELSDEGLDYQKDSAQDLQRKIKARIAAIREWVAENTHEETICFEV